MSKIESYQNRFRSNFQEQGVEFQRHLLRFNSKRKCKWKFQQVILQNSLACHVQLFAHTPHHTVVFSFAHTLHHTFVPSTFPTAIITLLCLQLCPHPSSHCCAFNFAHTLQHTVCLHLCPHPSSHCVPSTLPTPVITLLCHTILGSPVTCAEPWMRPFSSSLSQTIYLLIVKRVVPSRMVACNQRWFFHIWRQLGARYQWCVGSRGQTCCWTTHYEVRMSPNHKDTPGPNHQHMVLCSMGTGRKQKSWLCPRSPT